MRSNYDRDRDDSRRTRSRSRDRDSAQHNREQSSSYGPSHRNDRRESGGRSFPSNRGFSGSGGRGGGRGSNMHMGQLDSVKAFVRSNIDERAVLALVNPDIFSRDRDEIAKINAGGQYMPRVEDWRLKDSTSAGAVMWNNPNHIVTCNYFPLNSLYIPKTITQYSVSIFKRKHEQSSYEQKDDISSENDLRTNTIILNEFFKAHATLLDSDQLQNQVIGIAYDGRSMLFSSYPLNIVKAQSTRQAILDNDKSSSAMDTVSSKLMDSIQLTSSLSVQYGGWVQIGNIQFDVALKLAKDDKTESSSAITQSNQIETVDAKVVMALDTALLGFARWQASRDAPDWLITNTKAYCCGGTQFDLGLAYSGLLGYQATLKNTMSGIMLAADISVSCFLQGGDLVEVMARLGGYRSINDMIDDAVNYTASVRRGGYSSGGNTTSVSRQSTDDDPTAYGIPPNRLEKMLQFLKKCRIRLIHIGHTKKISKFGPIASHDLTRFDMNQTGELITVADYFRIMSKKDLKYRNVLLPGGELKYPQLPTVNVGSSKRPVLVPAELISVLPGQNKQTSITGDISSKIIKYAAMLPNDRMKFLQNANKSDPNSLLANIANDLNAQAFGLTNISSQPQKVQGVVLCPAVLQYGDNRVIAPELTGTWNLAGGIKFSHPAPLPSSASERLYPYSLIVVANFRNDRPDNEVNNFQRNLEQDSNIVGIPLKSVCRTLEMTASSNAISDALQYSRDNGARIVVVVMSMECYATVKFCADRIQIPTQCCKLEKLRKAPRGYTTNILMKMNLKLGGVNHTLADRSSPSFNGSFAGGNLSRRGPIQIIDDSMMMSDDTFQKPPASIGWVFDDYCMVVGVDVNHPDKGVKGDSVAALVGSSDGMLGNYACYISTCNMNEEPVSTLETAMTELLKNFYRKNGGNYPKSIIVYRDGISDSQFDEVLRKELTAYHNAIASIGYPEDAIKIAIIICQKRHSLRFFYQSSPNGDYMNPAVGLCVDGSGPNSICSVQHNEFYLNSHLAVLGTSKPCKYSLIYDDIGFKMAELELLTHWITHLYGRCTRSVSYATPAYYAHWAARRGKTLLSGGATSSELHKLSSAWLQDNAPVRSSMYFI